MLSILQIDFFLNRKEEKIISLKCIAAVMIDWISFTTVIDVATKFFKVNDDKKLFEHHTV